MSRTIDERVVEMRFDNKQFESGAKQTIGTLEKLKQTLNFKGFDRSFDNLQKSANRVDMSGLGNAVDSVKIKFSALEVVAITALSNIVNRAINAGTQLARSLSIDQVISGFGEYELKMGSIQTIMASTGESLSTVNKYLEELNEYSDKTIYSFSDMTSSIGKFTNAGVKLEDAVKAIQGISNEAAVSGANANEASRAMYNFAQALSAGYVKLIDWKSIENANMATVEFKQGLLDTALAMGTVVKVGDKYQTTTTDLNGKVSDLFDSTSLFNDSLAHQWMTTDVLVQTLGNYSTDVRTMSAAEKEAYEEKLRGIGYTEDQIKAIEELGKKAFDSAQDVKTFSQLIDTMRESVGSGWAQTFELIFGDFEEAKQLWTNVNNVLGAIIKESSDSRNELLRGWKEAGGRDALLGGITNSFNALLAVVKAVGKAFRNVFPKTTSDQLVKITKNFQNLTAKLIPSNTALDKLERTFTGLFSIVDILGQAIGAFFKLLVPGISTVDDLGDGILSITAFIGDWTTNLSKAIRENGIFIIAVENIRKTVENAINKIGEMAKTLFNLEDLRLNDSINEVLKSLKDLSLEISRFNFNNVEESFDRFKIKIQELLGLSMSNEGFAAFVKNFKEYGEELKEAFTLDNLLGRLERIMDVFGKFFNWIKMTIGPAFEDFNIGTAAAGAGGLGIVYALIKMSKTFENMSNILGSIPELLGGVKDTLVAYQKDLKASALIKTAGAIAILAAALVLLSFADTDRLLAASTALAVVAGVLMLGVSKLLEAINKGNKVNSSLTIFAQGLNNAMTDFGKAMKIKAIGRTVKDFAASIAIIAASIIALGIMWDKNPTAFSSALKTVGGISAVLVAITALMGIGSKFISAKSMASIGASILMITASLTLVVMAISKLMKMEIPDDYGMKLGILGGIIAGLGGLAVLLCAAAKIAGGNQLPKMASTIISLSVLLIATVSSLKTLFNMDLPDDYEDRLKILRNVFIGFGALLLVMGVAARIAKGNGIKAAGTILATAAFLAVVVASLFVLTLIPADKMLKGAIGLGGVLAALGVALYGAGKVSDKEATKAVIAMAATVGLIAASLSILSMIPWQKLLLSTVSLGSVLLALAANFKALSKVKVKEVIPSILAMIAATTSIAYSLYALSKRPWQSLLTAAAAMSATLLAFGACFAILSKVKVNLVAIGAVVAGSASLLLVAAGISMLAKYDGRALLNACLSLSAMLAIMLGAMAACGALSTIIGPAMAGVLGLGLVIAELAVVLAAVGGLAQIPGLKWLIGEGGILLQEVGKAIGNFVGGIIGGVMGGIAAQLPQIGTDLSNFMINLQPFIEGSKNIDAEALSCVGFLAAIVLALTAAEVVNGLVGLFGLSLVDVAVELSNFMIALQPFIENSRQLTPESMQACSYLASMILAITGAELLAGIGKFLGLGGSISDFGRELSEFGPYIKQFAEDVKDVRPESVQGAASAAEIMANMAKKLPASGGLVQKIFGEKSLAEFGNELVKFGPSIKQFGDIVKDVKPEAVQGAASAAEIMANLSNKLPEQGGLMQKIFGERSLSEFGEELVKFGPKISEFSDQIKDVDPSAVSGVSSITSIMTDLANNLPDSKSLWDKIFGGGKTTLADFGDSMVDFSKSLAGIDAENVEQAIDSLKSLANLSKYIGNTDASNIVEFANSLSEMAEDSVDKFVKTFSDSDNEVSSGINKLYDNVDTSIKNTFSKLSKTMETRGKQIIDGLNKGLVNNSSKVTKTVSNLAKKIDTSFCAPLKIHSPSKLGEERGDQWNQGVIEGLEKSASDVGDSSANVAKKVSDSFTEGLQPGVVSLTGVLAGVKSLQDQSIASEEIYWNNLLAIKRSGADAEKYQDMEMKDFRSSILQETTDIYNEYINKFKSTRDSLVDSMSIFSEVKKQEDVISKDDLQTNLQDQIDLYAEYATVMSSLNERIDGTALIEELRTLGVESTDQLKVINSMTDEELTSYSALYDQKLQAAGVAASTQLAGMQQEIEGKLSSLFGGMYAQVDLVDFSKIFDGSIESLNQYLNNIYLPLEELGQNVVPKMEQIGTSMTTGFETGISGFSVAASEQLGTAITTAFEGQSENAKGLSTSLGQNITAGITEGMTADTTSVQSSATELVNAITNYIKTAGEIHSPSELMKREVGAMIMQGIAEGMTADLTPITESATGIITAISDTLTVEGSETLQQSAVNISTILCEGLQNGIIQNQSLLVASGTALTTEMVNTINTGLPMEKLNPIGQNFIQGLINGINSKKPLATSTVKNLCTTIINQFRVSLSGTSLSTIGQNAIQGLINGINSKKSLAISVVGTLCSEIVDKFRENLTQSKFEEIGANAALGLKYGIESKIDDIADAAIRAAREAIDSAMEELDEASPSKVMKKVGEFFSIGFANGIVDRIREISIASATAADEAIDPVKKAVDGITAIIDSGDFDVDPVIRPVMDLSSIKEGVGEIGSLMDRTYNLSPMYNRVMDVSSSFNASKKTRTGSENVNSKTGEEAKYEFNQYNYSPKALTRSEIYRQTNNQFSAFRRAVNPT